MKDDLRYTATDVFDTFPFPDGALTDAEIPSAMQDAITSLTDRIS